MTFGDGTHTRANPISARDLGTILADCLETGDDTSRNAPTTTTSTSSVSGVGSSSNSPSNGGNPEGAVGAPYLNRAVDVGGPGPALSPAEQASLLFDLLGREVTTVSVPLGLLGQVIESLESFHRYGIRVLRCTSVL